jgi:hypothetical protein
VPEAPDQPPGIVENRHLEPKHAQTAMRDQLPGESERHGRVE